MLVRAIIYGPLGRLRIDPGSNSFFLKMAAQVNYRQPVSY
jgi:hypothetical protein